MTAPKPVFLTVQQVADRLYVSRMTAYRLIQSGELRGYRIGRSIRVELSDFNRYLRNAEVRS